MWPKNVVIDILCETIPNSGGIVTTCWTLIIKVKMDSNDGIPWSKALISNRYSSNTSLVKSFKTLMSPESGSIPK